MRLLVDADYFLYRAAAGAEYEAEITQDVWTYLCRITDAKDSFDAEMARLQGIAPDHAVVLVLGDTTNFRYAIYPDYKSNRRKYRRPAGYNALRDWAATTWVTLTLPNVEGDDVLGVMAEEGDVIVSRDKDLRTVPGCHLDGDGIIDVSTWQADFNFYAQVLTGDATDGYPGCKGVGAVGAGKALAGCKSPQEMWLAVVQAYTKAGHTIDFAVQMARCARILRPGEYDHSKHQPILWNPPAQ
jgi:DNA polymerase-1